MLACMFCGGVGEVYLIAALVSFIASRLKLRRKAR